MRIQVHRAPVLNQYSCAECGTLFLTILSADGKSVTRQHVGYNRSNCSQINVQFSQPIVLEPLELEAEVVQEIFK